MNANKPEAATAPSAVQNNETVACDAATSVWDAWLSRMYFDSLLNLATTRLN